MNPISSNPEVTLEPGKKQIDFNDQKAITAFGFSQATEVKGSLEAVKNSLNALYHNYLETLKLSDSQKQISINEKNQMIEHAKSEIETNDKYLNTLEEQKQKVNSKINQHQDEILDLKSGNNAEQTNNTTFIMGIVILVFLTIFLFLFYSSSIYSVFFGVPEDTNGFIVPDVFSMSLENGLSTFLLIVLLPMIFLCLGYIMHNTIEANQKKKRLGQKTSYLSLTAFILLAFCVDAIIGYQITQGVYSHKYISGEVDAIWQFNMIYSDITFYLILSLGFATYMIWGVCLHQVLSHPAAKSLDERSKNKIERINQYIDQEEKKIEDIIEDINAKQALVNQQQQKITKLQQEILDIRLGKISININAIKGYVGAFKNGWIKFISNYYDDSNSEKYTLEINQISDKWMEEKQIELKDSIKL
ncbi:hypothetical protein AS361_01515 [Myroides marinus]|uniref:YIP1 family protein n=1 Tax=Myroides marinus TaxID=703342 RepID=UPI000741C04C|nr:YIP1 family protein [Myroides marinus]KUF41720.1 hypothetical protein AS361_01515 [Myroides marinus]